MEIIRTRITLRQDSALADPRQGETLFLKYENQ